MHARVLLMLALRNLRRHLRRTALTAAAMIAGAVVMVFSFTLDDGSHQQWIDSGVRMGSGHVTVERPEYRVSRRIDDRLPAGVRRAAEQAFHSPELAPRVVALSAKLGITGLASSAAGSRPAHIVAVDPVAEAEFGTIDDQIVEGRYLEPGDELAACIGAGLADSLDLELGSRFVVQTQDAEREIAGQLLRVVGIVRSGLPAIDQQTIHVPLATAGDWLGSAGDVTNVGVVLDDANATTWVVEQLESALVEPVERGEVRVMGWPEADPTLATAIAVDALGNYIIQGFLLVIIAFGIVNTVLMSVMHRHREFGVLRALGLSPGQTGTIVLIEGLALAAASGLVGVGLGILIMWYYLGDGLDMTAFMEGAEDLTFGGVQVDPVIVPIFGMWRMVQITLFIVGVGCASAVYPALRAMRIDVTEAMKFDR